MRFLLASATTNEYVQQVALALWEAGALGELLTFAADRWPSVWSNGARSALGRLLPPVDRLLSRRRLRSIPGAVPIAQDWRWEVPRALAARLGLDPRVQDWLWERAEHRLDVRAARRLEAGGFDAYLGVEHGALAAVRAAGRQSRPSVVTFVSPHHAFRRRWVEPEYERHGELADPAAHRLLALSQARDARRDAEAAEADLLLSISGLTTRSLVDAGFPAEKVLTLAPGTDGAAAKPPDAGRTDARRFLYAGPLSVRKGGHHLLAAWTELAPPPSWRLDVYGIPLLPERLLADLPRGVTLRGSVGQPELFEAFAAAGLLVFPTLCDGFGLVVVEALERGCPVLTTRNAGAADLIEDGVNGFLVPAGDVGALRERLAWCVEHPEELRGMRQAAWESARRWTWSHFRTELRAGFAARGLLAGGRAGPEVACGSS